MLTKAGPSSLKGTGSDFFAACSSSAVIASVLLAGVDVTALPLTLPAGAAGAPMLPPPPAASLSYPLAYPATEALASVYGTAVASAAVGLVTAAGSVPAAPAVGGRVAAVPGAAAVAPSVLGLSFRRLVLNHDWQNRQRIQCKSRIGDAM